MPDSTLRGDHPPHLDGPSIRSLVSMAAAIEAIRETFSGPLHHVERTQIATDVADLLVMPAHNQRFAGVKSVMVPRGRPLGDTTPIGGSYVLLDLMNARAVATMDGAALTGLRTPAVTAVAIDVLSSHDAKRAVIVGRGPQAHGHAEALLVVRPDLEVTMTGRARTVLDQSALRSADIIITCTSSSTPVLDLDETAPHATIAAIGSYRPDAAELTARLVGACEVWVDDLQAARAEAGDLIQAEAAGWSWTNVRGDLALLCTGGVQAKPGRTLFKSVGLAAQDLAVAQVAWNALG